MTEFGLASGEIVDRRECTLNPWSAHLSGKRELKREEDSFHSFLAGLGLTWASTGGTSRANQ
jgi:hypothetical protein